jgi:biotin operon repressor
MKTAISLPDPLFRATDALAKRLGISRSELVQRAVAMLIDQHKGLDVTAALNEIYSRPDAPRSIDPDLIRLQLASLPSEEW